MNLERLIEKAQTSSFYAWLLNQGLWRKIPFNKPHKLKILKLTDEEAVISIPYIKSNLNHLKGLHACVLATAGEYASGLLILNSLGAQKYRVIMESLSVKYEYQGKTSANAIFKMSKAELESKVQKQLLSQDAVFLPCDISVYDLDGKLLCTVTTNWQIKSWDKVKLKV